MTFSAFLSLPTTVAFLSPWLGPTLPLLFPSAADLLPVLDVPSPLPPSLSAGSSGLCGSAKPGPSCSPSNSSRMDLILEDTVTPFTTSYSLETVRVTLASLCSPASDRDTLTFAQQAPLCTVYSSHSLRRGLDGCSREATHRGCRRAIWLDLCGHEGDLPPQRGLQRPRQPSSAT